MKATAMLAWSLGTIAAVSAALLLTIVWTTGTLSASSLNCNLSHYNASAGLTAAVEQELLVVSWTGQGRAELRARYAIDGGQPTVRDLSTRKAGGQWAALGQNLTPEYHVVSGVRRMTGQQAEPLVAAGVALTPEVIAKNRWYAFRDAPLELQIGSDPQGEGGGGGRGQGPDVMALQGGPPRAEDIRRADARFEATSCNVTTDGLSLEVTFPGVTMGIFSGDLRFTVYRGTNLLRMDVVARTDEPWVAYKYEAGLKGFSTELVQRVTWRDIGGRPQMYQFGGAVNDTRVRQKAANRVLVAEGKNGSVATFTPPHNFFWTRQVEKNLGYVWYRQDANGRFGLGILQPDHEEVAQYSGNFELYNAPPGTLQRMGVYFYASPEPAESTRDAVLAFTHRDMFKPLPGYKTMVNHLHLSFTERVVASGSLDTPVPDVAAVKALGVNIVGLSDFHGDLHANDPGPLRFKDMKNYVEAARRASDVDFLVTPWEEPSAYFGGHYNIMFPKPVYWTKVRRPGQPFKEVDPTYGTVYHTGNAQDVQQLLDETGGYWYHAHPRTKGTAGYPDLILDKPYTKNDRYLGVAFKPGMGLDLSETRLCEWRCFDSIDGMNNLFAGTGIRPKYIVSDIDTYQKSPEDDLYASFPVTYIKLDRLPGADENWSPILESLRKGDFFVTTGEILIRDYKVDGTGDRRTVIADVEWTFPLSFAEVVWGDGKRIDRQIISATDLPGFGTKRFAIPFDARDKTWVRFAVWDSAGNGAFVQPVWLTEPAVRVTTK